MTYAIKERKCSCRGGNPICQLCDGEGTYEVPACRRCSGSGQEPGTEKRCLNCRGTGEALRVDEDGEDETSW